MKLKPIVSLAKDKSSRWTIHVHPGELVNWLLFIPNRIGTALIFVVSTVFQVLTRSKVALAGYMMTLTSIGLVVGMALSISMPSLIRPLQLQAITPGVSVDRGTKLASVSIDQKEYAVDQTESFVSFFSIPRNRVVVLSQADTIGTTDPAVVAVGYFHPLRNQLLEVRLGQEIEIVGENNGVYRSTAVEIKELSPTEIEQFSDSNAVVVVPKTALGRSFRAIVFK